ncbi:MAG: hypothetical protein AAF206_27825 [Bacteroidota bacterium]
MTFEGTDIEIRIYGKAEFAYRLGISGETLRRYLLALRPLMEQDASFSKYRKTLFPSEIRLILIHIGYLPKPKSFFPPN